MTLSLTLKVSSCVCFCSRWFHFFFFHCWFGFFFLSFFFSFFIICFFFVWSLVCFSCFCRSLCASPWLTPSHSSSVPSVCLSHTSSFTVPNTSLLCSRSSRAGSTVGPSSRPVAQRRHTSSCLSLAGVWRSRPLAESVSRPRFRAVVRSLATCASRLFMGRNQISVHQRVRVCSCACRSVTWEAGRLQPKTLIPPVLPRQAGVGMGRFQPAAVSLPSLQLIQAGPPPRPPRLAREASSSCAYFPKINSSGPYHRCQGNVAVDLAGTQRVEAFVIRLESGSSD